MSASEYALSEQQKLEIKQKYISTMLEIYQDPEQLSKALANECLTSESEPDAWKVIVPTFEKKYAENSEGINGKDFNEMCKTAYFVHFEVATRLMIRDDVMGKSSKQQKIAAIAKYFTKELMHEVANLTAPDLIVDTKNFATHATSELKSQLEKISQFSTVHTCPSHLTDASPKTAAPKNEGKNTSSQEESFFSRNSTSLFFGAAVVAAGIFIASKVGAEPPRFGR